MRSDGRKENELRPIIITPNFTSRADGSVLISWGNTKILCTASIEEKVPQWLLGQGKGWITSEYSLLPGSTSPRSQREVSKGRASGRTMEIQRIVGRALRAAVDLSRLGERTIWIDCDVLEADGGTRIASVTGSYVALVLAIKKLQKAKKIESDPVICQIAGVSAGIIGSKPMVDLNYIEDSNAEVDMNFIMNDRDEFIEVQGTGEKGTFTSQQLIELMNLALTVSENIFRIQKQAIEGC
jgi:ribonuclease PH